jgi:hypothetical protein
MYLEMWMFDTRAAASLHVGRRYDIPCANRSVSISCEAKEVALAGMRERQCKNAMR